MLSKIIQGCMRIKKMNEEDLYSLIMSDIENGINYFDHADIYAHGECEKKFGKVLANHPEIRGKIILQTKCGIVLNRTGNYYDSSKQHILESVDNSLENLHTNYIDYLLIHRPDAFMNVREISDAFDILYKTGKVRHFGVSNFNKYQLDNLVKHCHQLIEVNQLQFSLCHTQLIDGEFLTNVDTEAAQSADSELMYYCKDNNIRVQAWSPFQFGYFEGIFLDSPKFPELNAKLKELAEKYNCDTNAIAVAWILTYSSIMSVIAGSTKINRMASIAKAKDIRLSKKEWYDLYRTAGHLLP
ncbi:MAG: aldo/keto reductase [Bacilli bacterium]